MGVWECSLTKRRTSCQSGRIWFSRRGGWSLTQIRKSCDSMFLFT